MTYILPTRLLHLFVIFIDWYDIFFQISWALLVFTNKVATVLVADFILGFTGSVFLIVPVYVGELSQNSIRGTLASGTVVFNGIGALTTFVLGEFLEYKTITYIGLTLATLALVLLSFLKESPTLLMKKGLEDVS